MNATNTPTLKLDAFEFELPSFILPLARRERRILERAAPEVAKAGNLWGMKIVQPEYFPK